MLENLLPLPLSVVGPGALRVVRIVCMCVITLGCVLTSANLAVEFQNLLSSSASHLCAAFELPLCGCIGMSSVLL